LEQAISLTSPKRRAPVYSIRQAFDPVCQSQQPSPCQFSH
jgi:hypothetical protein